MFFSAMCHMVSFSTLVILWFLMPLNLSEFVVKLFAVGAFLYCSYLLGSFFDTLPRFRISSKKKAVLITGCDSGFGHLLAHRLDSIGFKVFACCLFPEAEGAMKLRNCTSDHVEILKLDVADDASVQEVLKEVKESLNGYKLWAVVNNAGVHVRGELEWTPLEDYKRLFEVNTFGVVRVTQAFLPLLRESKGRVVTTASAAGRYSFPYQGCYSMSKHATVAFCDALRMEMAKFNVGVVTIEPFAYKSPMTAMETVLSSAEKTWSKVNKELQKQYGGKNYIEAFKHSLTQYNNISASPNIHEVVDIMLEAVTCTSPHYRYTVGDFKSMLGFWFIMRLPSFIGNYIVKRFIVFDIWLERCVRIKDEKKKDT